MKSYKEILEALKGKQHKIDKNKNGKIDAQDFKLLQKEESELTEATVKTQKYSWGTMKTVHHGADFSIPLHPEHHKAIAKLKDEQEHKFKTEDGKHWTARRKGDDVHFQGANNGGATKVKHSDLKEETEIDEAEDRMARSDYKVSPSGRKSHKQIVFANSDKKDEKEMKEQAPVAPVPDRKYIKGTKEYKEYMATKKSRVGHPTNEEVDKKKEDDLPFTPDAPKKNPIAKAGKFGIGPSTAKHLAKMGMQKAMKSMKEETDESEKMEMAQTQLHFIKYAAEEILEYIDMGGEVEEWYQNKLSKVMSEVESLHSYIEGEKRRTGMVDEEVEELDERNKENATRRKMMDASRGARFKAQGNYTPDPEPEHKTAQAHNKAVGRAIRQMSKEEVELDELNKSTLASYAKKATHDARIQQSIGKDFEADRSRKPGMKAAAKELADKYKSKSRKREAGVGKAIDRLAKEEVELDEKMNLATAKMGDVIKDFQTSDAPQFAGKSKEKRREMAIAAKLEADRGTKKEETEMLSYKEFMMMLEYEPKGGVYRHSGTYGSEYAKKEREKDEQGFDAKDDNQSQKRGRGRPAGAKSGARGPRIK
jgi:hypothetical protein